jgi:hypothetical protein
MRKVPKLAWQIRLVALIIAAGMSLHILEIYAFGGRFFHLVSTVLKATENPPVAAAKPKEPGLVPIYLLNEKKQR